MKINRKMTPEQRRASEARRRRHPDIMRRLEEMIGRYEKLNADRRAAQGQ